MFACTKFKDYVYGKPTVVETDHQPLVTIMKKPIHVAPARLQRMLLRLQSYDISLVYKKGKYMYLADTLSRAPSSRAPQSPVDNSDYKVMSVSYISSARLEELRKHTAEDEVLRTLTTVIKRGWPTRESQLQQAIGHYFPYRDELTMEDGVVRKGHKAVIPQSLHKEYINIVHKGHPGIEATKRRARSVIFWPTMPNDINGELLSCAVCNSTKSHQRKEPLQLRPVPWSTVAADIPEFPQSNGLAERAVRSAKQLMEKSHRDGSDVFLSLLNLRNIPRDPTLGSPAERLMSRQTLAAIPVSTKLLEPTARNVKQVTAQLLNKRLTVKRHYDKSSHPLQPLTEGQVIRMQTLKGYDKLGTVKEMSREPRSYIVQADGKTYRRNRRHILPVAEPSPLFGDPDPEDISPPTVDSPPPTQVPTPNTAQPQHPFSPQPKPTAHPPIENHDTQYTTRSGRICRPNPKYM